MTPRLKQILLLLLGEHQPISVSKLSDQIRVSKRTVQRELEYLPRALRAHKLTFASKTGVGVWIEGADADKQALVGKLQQQDDHDVSDRDYRRKRMILELLKEKGLKKLFWYSNKFKVSEATISTDLEALDSWFAQYDLRIVRKPGSGISVEGSEENYRKAISSFVAENIDTKLLFDSYHIELQDASVYSQFKKAGITQMLGEDVFKRVIRAIRGMESDPIATLTESSYLGLIMHISIAINRILQHETIETDGKWLEQFEEDEDFLLAQRIVYELEEEFEVTIPRIETSYICLHIKGSKHERIAEDVTKQLDMQGQKLKTLVNQMIYAFDENKAYLIKQDDEFLQGLLAHLQPTIVRLAYNMKIHNPVLAEIKSQYADIFNRCQAVAKVLQDWTGKSIPEEEIGFIAVHFGAAMVRLEERQEYRRVVQVGVVCSSGIGISRMMATKLKRVFQDRILLTAYSKREIVQKVLDKEDFLISSIHLEQEDIEVIEVNPLLNDHDLQTVKQAVNRYECMPAKQEKISLGAGIDELHFLATQIKGLLAGFALQELSPHLPFEQALTEISQCLTVDPHCQTVIQEDLLAREMLSTQLFSEFGFGLLHAKTHAVCAPTLQIFVPADKDAFLHPELKAVKMLFVMLIPNDDDQKLNGELMGCISSSLVEDDLLTDAVLTRDSARIKSCLTSRLKRFFSEYLTKVNPV